MGYESKLIVVNRKAFSKINNPKEISWIYGEQIAQINMSKMDNEHGWLNLFNKAIDYKLFIEDGDHDTNTDKYGDVMKYASISKVCDWLEREIANGDDYRRLKPLLGLLRGFDEQRWDELQVVHYGY